MRKIDEMRSAFLRMGTPQKKEFIERFGAQEAAQTHPEYMEFYDECIRVYKNEVITDPGSFTAQFHMRGRSTIFLVGILLWQAGMVLNAIFTNLFFAFIPIVLLILPAVGFWLIFAASKSPRLPEKSLTSITLFKISVIIEMIPLVLVAVGASAFFIFSGVRGETVTLTIFFIEGSTLALFLIFAAICAARVFYYIYVFRVLNGIADGLRQNITTPLRSATPFIVFSGIFIALAALVQFAVVLSGSVEATGFFSALGSFMAIVGFLFSLASHAGMILILVSFAGFNSALKELKK
ncbi:MAG: hypothetical protein FWC70_04230 [Defluviitaleaceae bacterium]|nr:hypothetical protein [Defluviitaleaceae bacterium]